MKQKTIKGKIKKAGFWALCCSPMLVAVGCLVFIGVSVGKSEKFGDKARAIENKLYEKTLQSDEYIEHCDSQKLKFDEALKNKTLTTNEYSSKVSELTTKNYVLDYAKFDPENATDIATARDCRDKSDKWAYGMFALAPAIPAAAGGLASISYAFDKGPYMNFDNCSDVEKRKNRLEKKKEKIEKALSK